VLGGCLSWPPEEHRGQEAPDPWLLCPAGRRGSSPGLGRNSGLVAKGRVGIFGNLQPSVQ
jgi:hypothetical protein